MVQADVIKTFGYVGSLRQRDISNDEQFYKTYGTELTLSEKYSSGKTRSSARRTVIGDKSNSETKEGTNSTTCVWLIGFFATLAVFSSSKIGQENIRRVITDCGRPSKILYGAIVADDGTKYGSRASVVCSVGYTSSKPETICQSNGKWSTVYCHETDCGKALPMVEYGHLTLNKEQDSTYGATATVTCAPGYTRSKKKVTCEENGHWEEALCLPVDCGVPEIDYGKPEFGKTTYMSKATVKCWPGYVPNQSTISCTATGTWQNARCYNVDDCSPNPCKNNGVCVDKVADFSCQCPQWFSGKSCEIDNRPCTNNKCRNGAVCIDLPDGGYKCNCAPHWDGQFCERHH